jgi:prepilin-type N-terminal cleavage/methylation domain-containing protein
MLFIRPRKGFTIVELVVVLAIIFLLTSVALMGADAFRKKSRDTERRAELQQLALALRLYKDSYGTYPAAGCGAAAGTWASPGPGVQSWYLSCDTYIPGLVPSFMPELPTDPNEMRSDGGYLYRTNAAGTEYKVISNGTVETGSVDAGEPMARCPSSCIQAYCSGNTYAVYSPGAACW